MIEMGDEKTDYGVALAWVIGHIIVVVMIIAIVFSVIFLIDISLNITMDDYNILHYILVVLGSLGIIGIIAFWYLRIMDY